MKHPVVKVIIKICAETLLLTTVVAIVIVVIGKQSNWTTALAYSNAFFVGAAFVIIGGLASRLSPSQDASRIRLLSSAESLRGMSMSERLDAATHGSTNLAIVCVLSAILLMIISELVAKMF